MSVELESTILASSTQLITLNTRITQKACNELDLIRGWLQATGQLRAVTKQSAIDWAIQYAYKALNEAMASEDQGHSVQIASNERGDTEKEKTISIGRSMPFTKEELEIHYGTKF